MAETTTDREAAYQETLGVARHSYLAYVVESSSPVVVDDADRRLMKLFQELWEKERHYVEVAYELLEKTGLRPMPPTYPIKASNFNFLRPFKLAEHWPDQVSDEVARLTALRARLPGGDPFGPELLRLIDDFLALRRESMKRVAELRAEVAPKPPPPPPQPAPAAKPAAPAAPAAPAPPAAQAPPAPKPGG